MSFWKNPQYSAVRVLIIVVLVIVAGYFAYKYENTSKQLKGQVISQTMVVGTTTTAGEVKSGAGGICQPHLPCGTGQTFCGAPTCECELSCEPVAKNANTSSGSATGSTATAK